MTRSSHDQETARGIATALLDAGCVSARRDEPFRLPSGWATPVYMDCRRIISFPKLRRLVVDEGLKRLRQAGALEGVDAVVGGEASGIALAAWMADALELPLHYVRKKAAGQSQVEGVLHAGDRVLLVDDMMAAGQSKLRFCQALATAGAQVRDLFIVFDYGVFPTQAALDAVGVKVHALACWRDVLDVARARADFPPAILKELQDFLDDPAGWSQAHGGRGSYAGAG